VVEVLGVAGTESCARVEPPNIQGQHNALAETKRVREATSPAEGKDLEIEEERIGWSKKGEEGKGAEAHGIGDLGGINSVRRKLGIGYLGKGALHCRT
jgi:hypothetical protein